MLAAGMNNAEIAHRLVFRQRVGKHGRIVIPPGDFSQYKVMAGGRGNTLSDHSGTDCCGIVVALGEGGASLAENAFLFAPALFEWFQFDGQCLDGVADFDGAFAQFVTVPRPSFPCGLQLDRC